MGHAGFLLAVGTYIAVSPTPENINALLAAVAYICDQPLPTFRENL